MIRECSFERELSVSISAVDALRFGFAPMPWAEFILNPRRLRGSDFLMRWPQGVWSGHILPFVLFEGGSLCLEPEALRVLRGEETRQ